DYNAIVTQLVNAEFGPQTQNLQSQSNKLDTKISAVGSLKSNLNDFYNSLSQLVSGGTLATQPTSSDATIVKASVIPGQSASGLA
ncbi:flagellar cap protein FliD N-terminal domain-containing protein, partial [Acinetobacter baumannii]